jgi:hypothetical protein
MIDMEIVMGLSPLSEDFSEKPCGVLILPGAGEILALEHIGDRLFAIAENGVWQIIQTDEGGLEGLRWEI